MPFGTEEVMVVREISYLYNPLSQLTGLARRGMAIIMPNLNWQTGTNAWST
jgi:hypothetical protein